MNKFVLTIFSFLFVTGVVHAGAISSNGNDIRPPIFVCETADENSNLIGASHLQITISKVNWGDLSQTSDVTLKVDALNETSPAYDQTVRAQRVVTYDSSNGGASFAIDLYSKSISARISLQAGCRRAKDDPTATVVDQSICHYPFAGWIELQKPQKERLRISCAVSLYR